MRRTEESCDSSEIVATSPWEVRSRRVGTAAQSTQCLTLCQPEGYPRAYGDRHPPPPLPTGRRRGLAAGGDRGAAVRGPLLRRAAGGGDRPAGPDVAPGLLLLLPRQE